MKKLISLFLLGVFCAGLTACGVKGPLYFPEQQPADRQQSE